MNVKSMYMSDENINNASRKLAKHFNATSANGINSCKKLLLKEMPNIYNTNKSILNKGQPNDIVKHLTNKALQSCVNIYNSRSQKGKIQKQIGNKGQQKHHGPQMMDSSIGGAYAPFTGGGDKGTFITASGEWGQNFVIDGGYGQNDMQFSSKKDAGNDIERKMLERQGGYSHQSGGNNQDNRIEGFSNTSNQNGGFSYNPNIGQQQQRSEINFALDGRDSRASQNTNTGLDKMENMENFDGFNNFNGFGEMDFGGGQQGYGGMDFKGGQQGYSSSQGYGGGQISNDQMQQMIHKRAIEDGTYGHQSSNQQMLKYQQPSFQQPAMGNNINKYQDQNQNQNQNQNQYQNEGFTEIQNQQNMMMQQMMTMFEMMYQMKTSTTDNNSIESRNNELRTSIADRLGIDPQQLANMSSDDIDILIDTVSNKNKKKHISKQKNVKNDSDSSDNEPQVSSIDKIKHLLKLKKEHNKKQEKIRSIMNKSKKNKKTNKNHESSDESESEKKYKKTNQSNDNSDPDSEFKSDSNTDSDSKKKYKKTNSKNTVNSSNNNYESESESETESETESNSGSEKKYKKTNLKNTVNSSNYNSESESESGSESGSKSETNSETEKKTIKNKHKKIVSSSNVKLTPEKVINKNESLCPEDNTRKKSKKKLVAKNKKVDFLLKNIVVDESNLNSFATSGNYLYNDYLINFEEIFNTNAIADIIKIKLQNINLPFIPYIDDTCNRFRTICDNDDPDDPEELSLGVCDNFTIEEIIESFNDCWNKKDYDLTISITKDNRIIVKHNNNEAFTMDFRENSVAKYLGFTETLYEDECLYKSEKAHCFNNSPVYMYLKSISGEEPFAIIKPGNKITQILKEFNKPVTLSCIIIQFKYKQTPKDNYFVNFADLKHSYVLNLELAK
jgi:hypothetical protein